jgi:hypothetical protein
MESTSTIASADTKPPKDHMAECVDFVIRRDRVSTFTRRAAMASVAKDVWLS